MKSLAVLLSRISGRLRRLVIHKIGIGNSKVTYLNLGETRTTLSFSKLDSYSKSMQIEVFHPRDKVIEGHSYQARYLYSVEDVYLDLVTGIATSSKGAILAESSSWPESHLLLNALPRPPVFTSMFDAAEDQTIIAMPSNGFYHWFIEDLAPFIFAYKNTCNPIVLVYDKCPKYVASFLAAFKIKIQLCPRFMHLKNYTFTSKGQDTGWPHPKDIEVIRTFFSGSIKPLVKNKKIYISRLSSSRSPKFELELQETLANNGWLILETEKMSLIDQALILSQAQILCGVHGAGLSGMTWMKSGSMVIELGPSRFVPCFSRMSQICGHEYLRIEFNEDAINIPAEVTLQMALFI